MQPPEALWIEGYTDHVSRAPGETVQLHVSTSGEKFDVTIARLGAERDQVYTKKHIPGATHPIPENASSHGCNWPAAHALEIPSDWKSGFYEVRFTTHAGGGQFTHRSSSQASSTAYFILRSANPGAYTPILLQLATNTYNAYNNWGGRSLYGYHAHDKIQGTRVTFNRPSSTLFARWELPFIQWAEANGYVLDYAANLDLELQPDLLDNYRLVLSVGHDEYWSSGMRDSVEDFIAAGGNAAFFSGNSVCWQVRVEEEGRALTSYKQSVEKDPLFGQDHDEFLSTLWSHHLVGRPENMLTGVGFLSGGYHRSHEQLMDGSGAFEVHRPDHWVFEGTDVKRGDTFGGEHTIVGYECDGCEQVIGPDGLPVPTYRDGTPDTFVILATQDARWHPDDAWWYGKFDREKMGSATMGTYTQGGTVFTAGTTDWAHGLKGGDTTVDQITRNVIDRLAK